MDLPPIAALVPLCCLVACSLVVRADTPGEEAVKAAIAQYGTPEEILDRRVALGEIDAETYQRMRTEIASARTGQR